MTLKQLLSWKDEKIMTVLGLEKTEANSDFLQDKVNSPITDL